MNPKKPVPAGSRRADNENRRLEASKERILENDEDANAGSGIAISALVVIMLVFVVWRISNSQAAQTKADCATNYTGDTPAITKCKSDTDTFLTIAVVVLIVALLAGGGLWAQHKIGR